MNRNFQYTEYAGPTTVTAATTHNVITHAMSGVELDEEYLVINTVAAGTGPDGLELGGPFSVETSEDGGTGVGTICDIAIRDPGNDMYSVPFIYVARELVTTTFNLYLDIDLPTLSGALTYRQAGIYALRLTEKDVYNADAGGSTTSSTTFVDVTDSDVTIPETGEYIVIATASIGKDELTANFEMQLAVNGSGLAVQTMRAVSTTKQFPYGFMRKLSLTAGDVLTLMQRAVTTGSVTTQYGRICALRVDEIPAVLYQEDTGSDSTTSTSYADKAGMGTTFRTQNFAALMLSFGIYRRGGTTVDAWTQTLCDGTTVQESRNETVAANHESCHFAAKGWTPSEGDHTIKQQYKSDGSGITSAFLTESAIAVLTLEDNATVRIRGGQILGGQIW